MQLTSERQSKLSVRNTLSQAMIMNFRPKRHFLSMSVTLFELYIYFCGHKKQNIMAHGNHNEHHHGHQEAEQNEIGGPVTFAIFCFAVAVVIIYFVGKYS